MKIVLFITLLLLMSSQRPTSWQKNMEYAYFCGQRDAIFNDVIIRKLHDDVWIWEKSPWTTNLPVLNDTIFDF